MELLAEDFNSITGAILDDGTKLIIEGTCNRCGICCEVYESGKPCRHLIYDSVIIEGEEQKLAMCNSLTLVGGYWGRPLGCAIYPLQNYEILPEKCSLKVVVSNG